MEIITMESTAYKELVEKIDRIAGYVRDSERSKKGDGADVWLCNEEVMSLLGISRRTLPTPAGRRTYPLRHFQGRVPLPFLGGGAYGRGIGRRLQSARAGRFQT